VRDHCGGLDGEKLDLLFERYFRGQADEGVRGLGLGLYLARRFATVLDWQIDVENFPGEGCEFRILAGKVAEAAESD
jgi:signal transduction histidine kinase